MRKLTISTGIYWVEIPEAGLYVLCGCPADSVKHLIRRGLIMTQEKQGVTCETGPNAILLSDLAVQNERFCNLAEFPVLQMLYRQGMILPGHPNNTGQKPLLIGSREQVAAQSSYIYQGNYGLADEKELAEAGATPEMARDIMRMKRRFAYDNIRKTEELLDLCTVGSGKVEIRNGAYIRRKALNVFEFSYGDASAEVNLNLASKQDYEAPYQLGYHGVRREYFSVIHSGEGDGWDPNRPCMASIITFQGKIYLIDAGPNIVHSLHSLGLSANDVEGVFHTHAHDDHFTGLTVLMRSDHKLKYYATSLVRTSVFRKLSALLSVKEEHFERYFEMHDLAFDTWNDVEGLEVQPILSPHPVETNILIFRTLWEDGYKTYAHYADISAFSVLKAMLTDDPNKSGISQEFFNRVKDRYLQPATLKKIDIGGGLIHGDAEDFATDTSGKIVLSHTSLALSDRQKEIGSNSSFGMIDVMISTDQDNARARAFGQLRSYFPDVPAHELRMLLNCALVAFNPGTLLVRRGEQNDHLYFILSGVLELIATDHGVHNILASGAIAGELSGILGTASRGAYRATSRVTALRIPCALYREFLSRNGLFEEMKHDISMRRFLESTWLFGEMISCPVKNTIVRRVQVREWDEGVKFSPNGKCELFMVREGELQVTRKGSNKVIRLVGPRDFFGAEYILYGCMDRLSAQTSKHSVLYHIPGDAIDHIPIIQWKLLESYEVRHFDVEAAED